MKKEILLQSYNDFCKREYQNEPQTKLEKVMPILYTTFYQNEIIEDGRCDESGEISISLDVPNTRYIVEAEFWGTLWGGKTYKLNATENHDDINDIIIELEWGDFDGFYTWGMDLIREEYKKFIQI